MKQAHTHNITIHRTSGKLRLPASGDFQRLAAPTTLMRALFVCTQNRLRSPTAEQVFSRWGGIECESAGTSESAGVPLGKELIEWAEVIFVMEKAHRNRLSKRWRKHLANKRVVCLDIPDEYEYMDPSLVRVLEDKVSPYLLARGCRPPRAA